MFDGGEELTIMCIITAIFAIASSILYYIIFYQVYMYPVIQILIGIVWVSAGIPYAFSMVYYVKEIMNYYRKDKN